MKYFIAFIITFILAYIAMQILDKKGASIDMQVRFMTMLCLVSYVSIYFFISVISNKIEENNFTLDSPNKYLLYVDALGEHDNYYKMDFDKDIIMYRKMNQFSLFDFYKKNNLNKEVNSRIKQIVESVVNNKDNLNITINEEELYSKVEYGQYIYTRYMITTSSGDIYYINDIELLQELDTLLEERDYSENFSGIQFFRLLMIAFWSIVILVIIVLIIEYKNGYEIVSASVVEIRDIDSSYAKIPVLLYEYKGKEYIQASINSLVDVKVGDYMNIKVKRKDPTKVYSNL